MPPTPMSVPSPEKTGLTRSMSAGELGLRGANYENDGYLSLDSDSDFGMEVE